MSNEFRERLISWAPLLPSSSSMWSIGTDKLLTFRSLLSEPLQLTPGLTYLPYKTENRDDDCCRAKIQKHITTNYNSKCLHVISIWLPCSSSTWNQLPTLPESVVVSTHTSSDCGFTGSPCCKFVDGILEGCDIFCKGSGVESPIEAVGARGRFCKFAMENFLWS